MGILMGILRALGEAYDIARRDPVPGDGQARVHPYGMIIFVFLATVISGLGYLIFGLDPFAFFACAIFLLVLLAALALNFAAIAIGRLFRKYFRR